jgi:hypothetical protein
VDGSHNSSAERHHTKTLSQLPWRSTPNRRMLLPVQSTSASLLIWNLQKLLQVGIIGAVCDFRRLAKRLSIGRQKGLPRTPARIRDICSDAT